MIGIMSAEYDNKHIQYSKCDKERALQVLSSLRLIKEHHLLNTQACISPLIDQAVAVTEKLVDVLIDVRKTERILIVDGKANHSCYYIIALCDVFNTLSLSLIHISEPTRPY